MADNKPQEHENKDAESGEPIQLDKDQPQQPQRKPQQQHEDNEAGGMKQGADRPQPEGGQKTSRPPSAGRGGVGPVPRRRRVSVSSLDPTGTARSPVELFARWCRVSRRHPPSSERDR